jgi:hypothetical protein
VIIKDIFKYKEARNKDKNSHNSTYKMERKKREKTPYLTGSKAGG